MQLEDEFKCKNRESFSESSLDNSSAISKGHLKDKHESFSLLVNMKEDNNAIMSNMSHEKNNCNPSKEKL